MAVHPLGLPLLWRRVKQFLSLLRYKIKMLVHGRGKWKYCIVKLVRVKGVRATHYFQIRKLNMFIYVVTYVGNMRSQCHAEIQFYVIHKGGQKVIRVRKFQTIFRILLHWEDFIWHNGYKLKTYLFKSLPVLNGKLAHLIVKYNC